MKPNEIVQYIVHIKLFKFTKRETQINLISEYVITRFKTILRPTFTVTPEYKESLPDLQNGPASLINGANVPIQQVGISNFKLPLHVKQRDGKTQLLEVSVEGYVSLDANKKGINMGRIMRTFFTVLKMISSLWILLKIY